MKAIKTKFTELMKIQSPIVAAPMYYASTPSLAAAVTAAGGFGFIAAGFETSSKLKQDLKEIRESLQIPVGKPVPTGVGLLGWILDGTEKSDDPRIPAVLDELPSAIWFAFGNDLGRHVATVRHHDEQRDHKTKVFVIINSLNDALRAANEWKVDVLVVQGNEAGGHGSATAPPLFALLQAVLNAIPNGPSIIAAGGITTGSQISALLTMGAHGVALGTRFLYTTECMYPQAYKSVLLQAELNATARSYAFDEVNRTAMWPAGIDGRAISNQILEDVKAGVGLEERLNLYDAGKKSGEEGRMLIWAGAGVGLVKTIETTAEVMHTLQDEIERSLNRASAMIT